MASERVAGALDAGHVVRARTDCAMSWVLGRREYRASAQGRVIDDRGEAVEQFTFTDVSINKLDREMVKAVLGRGAPVGR